jgi:hypothetical protein
MATALDRAARCIEAVADEPATGRAAYEADVRRRPNYSDGAPRPGWDDIGEVARWSWNRNPTPRGDA